MKVIFMQRGSQNDLRLVLIEIPNRKFNVISQRPIGRENLKVAITATDSNGIDGLHLPISIGLMRA